MSTKVTTQQLIERLAQSANITKKAAESFVKAFSQTVLDGITSEDAVKAKGIGTFKLVQVADRESINVNTGERIIIPGYRKLNFTSDGTIDELLNQATEEAPAPVEEPKVEEPTAEEPKAAESISSKIEEGDHEVVEEYDAKEPENPKEEPKAAESISSKIEEGDHEVVEEYDAKEPETPKEEPKVAESISSKIEEGDHEVVEEYDAKVESVSWFKKNWWIVVSIATVIVIALLIVLVANKGESEPVQEQPQPTVDTRSYKPYMVKQGESLKTISITNYGTVDSVPVISRINGISDSTAIEPGTIIKLP